MNHEERNALIATIGLAIAAFGAFLPWARIGGRNRSGFNTADTFISLSEGALPDQIAWVGRWWYAPAFLAFISWATAFLAGRRATRAAALVFLVVGLIMWWLFVWAGENYNLLDMQLVGPIIATTGFLVLGYACGRRRKSILNPDNAPS